MNWNPKAGQKIASEKGKEMVDRYRKENPNGIRSIYFDSAIVTQLLSAPNAAGLSIQFAKNDANENTVVLYAVDSTGKLLTSETDPVNVGNPCPPYCPMD
jgi:hypothetical protein